MKNLLKVVLVIGLLVFCFGNAMAECTLEQRTMGLCTQTVVWRNLYSGEVYAWTVNMTNPSPIVGQASLGVKGTNWEILRMIDLNGDGQEDILWRDTWTGEVRAWLLVGLVKVDMPFNAYIDGSWIVAK